MEHITATRMSHQSQETTLLDTIVYPLDFALLYHNPAFYSKHKLNNQLSDCY